MTGDKDFAGDAYGQGPSSFDFQNKSAGMTQDDAATEVMQPLSSTPYAAPMQQAAQPIIDLAAVADAGSPNGTGATAVAANNKKKPVGLIILLSILAAIVLLLAAYVTGGQWYFQDKAAPGVKLGNVSVMGKNASELKTVVEDAVADSKVKVTINDASTEASLKDLGVSVDVDKTVNDLLNAKKDSIIGKVNPFAKTSVALEASTDKLTMTTYLSDQLIGEDARVINASVSYDSNAKKFVTSFSKSGQSPVTKPVEQQVSALASEPGRTVEVTTDTEEVESPITNATADKTASAANLRLTNRITISNGDNKSFTIPASQIAKWITTTGDPAKGTITLNYDQKAVASYLAAELPKQLNQKKVTEENVKTSEGTVITTEVKGVNGIDVDDTSTTANEVLKALTDGKSASLTAKTKVTKYDTKSRTVRYDVPNGDPWMKVDLSAQQAYAYKGTTLVKTFNVSTGKTSTPTNTGTYFANIKYATQTMRGEDYVTPNVPWVTYFNGGEGFHGASWNPDGIASGTPKSHGCVNMNVSEAKWVYDFLPIGGMVQVVGSTPSSAVR